MLVLTAVVAVFVVIDVCASEEGTPHTEVPISDSHKFRLHFSKELRVSTLREQTH